MSKNKIIMLVCIIGVLVLGLSQFPIHWFVAPLGLALVVALPLGVLYALVRFVKACWNRP